MEPSKRPICYRLPSGIYHDTFESMGAASLTVRDGECDADKLESLTLDLLSKIANTLENGGVTYETWPESWK